MQRVCLLVVLFVTLVAAASTSAQPVPEAIFVHARFAGFSGCRSRDVEDERAGQGRCGPSDGRNAARSIVRQRSRARSSQRRRPLVGCGRRARDRVGAHRAWVGSIEGIPYSHVSFTERDGVVSGLINAVSESYAVQTTDARCVYAIGRVVDTDGELQPRLSTRLP